MQTFTMKCKNCYKKIPNYMKFCDKECYRLYRSNNPVIEDKKYNKNHWKDFYWDKKGIYKNL
jgi:hypothetical protein